MYTRHCVDYEPEDTTVGEGIRLRRVRSPSRISAYPKLQKAVTAMEWRGERRRVLETLKWFDLWMVHVGVPSLASRKFLNNMLASAGLPPNPSDEVVEVEVVDLTGEEIIDVESWWGCAS
jgi:hypothetical protein